MKKQLIILGIGFVIIIVLGIVLVATRSSSTSQTTAEPTTQPTATEINTTDLGTFKGILPCADCPGLETEIAFTKKDIYSAEGTFSMTETYLEKSVKPIETKGEWTTLRGTKKNPDASVYQLNPGKPEESTYYLKVDEMHIKMLDKDQNEIEGTMNFTLTKQP